MNSQSFTLAERLIPSTYLQQAAASKKTRENLIRQLIEQVCCSFHGFVNIILLKKSSSLLLQNVSHLILHLVYLKIIFTEKMARGGVG